MPQIDL